MKWVNVLKLFVGISLSGIGVFVIFREKSPIEIWEAIQSGNIFVIFLAGFVLISSVFVRAYRWKYILPQDTLVTLRRSYESTMIGNMLNNILPFRLGEVGRLMALRQLSGVKIRYSISSIAIERIFDLFMLVIIFFVASGFYIDENFLGIGKRLLVIISVLVFLAIILAIVITNYRKLPGKIGEYSDILVQSIRHLGDKKNGFKIVISSFVLWGMYCLTTALVFYAFDVPQQHLVIISATYLVGASLAYSIPSAPGGIGTYHGVGIALLTVLLAETPAISNKEAIVIVVHSLSFILFTILGIIHVLSLNLGLRELVKK